MSSYCNQTLTPIKKIFRQSKWLECKKKNTCQAVSYILFQNFYIEALALEETKNNKSESNLHYVGGTYEKVKKEAAPYH